MTQLNNTIIVLFSGILLSVIPALGQSLQQKIKTVPDAKWFFVGYDKSEDATVVSMYIRFRYPKGKLATLSCIISGGFAGTELSKDIESFGFVCSPMYTMGKWAFSRDPRLIFLLDGQQLDLGVGKHEGTVGAGPVSDEWLLFKLTREDVRKLAEAKLIEIRLGDYEGRIEKDGQARIKTFYDLTAKPK